MMRKLAALAAQIACLASLSGCIALGGVDRDAATIDKSVGTARNSSILLNIVRASRNEPLYFYTINQVQGAGTEDFKFSLPPLTLGPRQTVAQQNFTFGTNGTNILDSQRSGFFNVGILDSKNFYAGMLAPLDLVAVNILLKKGFPRELIYRLAVDDITLYGPMPTPGPKPNPDTRPVGLFRFANSPLADPRASLMFNIFLDAAMSRGITTEEYYVKSSAPSRADASGGGGGGDKDSSGETVNARLCADVALVDTPDARADVTASHNACGERPIVLPAEVSGPQQVIGLEDAYKACKTAQAPSAPTDHPTNQVCAVYNGDVYAIQLDTRSLFGIFRYLGAAMANHADIELTGHGSQNEPLAKGPLITVVKDRQHDCFAAADWHDHYCIPSENSDNLKQAFSIINALQALKTSPGDLPFTPTVRIQQ